MPDVRLIDANAIVEKLQSYYESLSPDVYSELIRRDEVSSCIAELINAPTIDAQPVMLGKWVDYGSGVGMYCSECKHRIRYRNGIREKTMFSDGKFNFVQYASKNGYYNFCPKCGAKMDGSESDEQT